ncbi:VWA domain-containing protein [Halarcobacter sp.]|uniref:VWA domain-containing protein n=1 Tax=Halarcobacter sp. TaxID=2321133 RepID=UPI003AFFEF16
MQFLYPNVLFFMLIPIIILMFLITTNKDKFQRFFDKEALAKLSVKNKYMTKTTRNILFFLVLILMTISLARPVINEKEHKIDQETVSFVIALDVSKSMLATDIYPNRLSLGKKKILDIIDYAKQNSIAVVLFAKSSFILSPITQDFNSLKILVNRLDTGLNFDNGSNIFSTLEVSKKLLKNVKDKNLILITDGANKSDYEKEIEYAKENNIRIYTLGLATNKPTPIKLQDGNFLTKDDGSIVTVKLNEDIKQLSLSTDAAYIKYSNSSDDIKQVIDDINITSKKQKQESRNFKTYTELFYYPLGLALFILLIAFSSRPKLSEIFKKNKNLALLALVLILSNNSLKAFEFDFQTINKANEHYEKQEYEKASKEFRKVAKTPESHYNLGNALYKQGEYKKALMHYKNVVSSNQELEYKKLHNMGNSYVKLNDLQNAKRVYEKALKIKDDKQTKENLKAVLKALKDKNKDKQNQQNKNEQNQSKDGDKKNKDDKKQEQDKSQEDKEKDSKEKKEKQDNKNSEENSSQKEQKNQEIKQNQLSDAEEKKWLKKLEQAKEVPVMLKKFDSKEQSDDTSTPW